MAATSRLTAAGLAVAAEGAVAAASGSQPRLMSTVGCQAEDMQPLKQYVSRKRWGLLSCGARRVSPWEE